MPQPQHHHLTETLLLEPLSPQKFQSKHPPQRAGNALNIAYGGFTIAAAAQTACKTAPPNYHLYTLMGNFLGPAFCDRPLLTTSRVIRHTRTFYTVQVEVLQSTVSKDGKEEERACLVALADFQIQEAGDVLTYSAPPRFNYQPPKNLPPIHDNNARHVAEGRVSQKLVSAHNSSFSLFPAHFDIRPCPEGIFAQNLNGVAKTLATTQDALPITSKTTADWWRCGTPLPTQTDNIAAVAFVMDGSLSFVPLSFSNMFLDDVEACSTLDFALRVFSNKVDFGKWVLREVITHAGAEGRTYSEARMWDEEGKMLACMTQQSIMRKKAEGKGKL
ncbi:Thioesterase/thiol ester dehydrase-isomerase [Massarina eburnea CBS 473.64]|uniref:Thioesterase/thiol ester dehydrase-isomerase n=1 Tax=Massarina eburnea CBS 473.64 TaxID=1395130 RepID=A0A6A6S5D7_9PLEO|nr:Thioesterase/thiol ester dehydrase-isomerase [Massarina eburnea CBS 473.64]